QHGDEHSHHHAPEHADLNHEQEHHPTHAHGIATFGHAQIAELAYELWESKGRPDGTADEDWYEAARQLRARARTA
ncbi:MAG TPA: DUF2934 domain-containing protein, partial [Bryobacteraceae bacterium]